MAAAPTVRRRRLGIELRRLREHVGRTVEEIAERLDWSPSKLSRIENARIGVRVSDVRLLLELYRVDESHKGEVLALAQAATEQGWWAEYRDVLSGDFGTYVALEDEAHTALTFGTYAIPGLLQNREYAHRILDSGRVIAVSTPRQVERRLELRMRRQEVLRRENPLALSAVIDESVLLRAIGDRDTADIFVRRGARNRMRLTAGSPAVRAVGLLAVGILSVGVVALAASPVLLFLRG